MMSPTALVLSSWDSVIEDDAVAKQKKSELRKKFRTAWRSDLWNFLFFFPQIRAALMARLLKGTFRFDFCEAYRPRGRKEWIAIRPVFDRFVIKLLKIYLKNLLNPALDGLPYFHKKGRGRIVALKLFLAYRSRFKFVYKTDVKSYYASIPQRILLQKLSQYVQDARVLDLIVQVISPTIHINGMWIESEIRSMLSRHELTTRYYKTFVGRLTEMIAYLGYRFFTTGSVGVSRESLEKRRLNVLQCKAQRVSNEDLCSYLTRWKAAFGLASVV